MNKTAIKNFAIWARNKLIADIVYKAGLLGVTEKGIANALPQSTRDVQFFDIGTKDYMTVRGNAIRQRDAFVAAIKEKQVDTNYAEAFRFVVEKVAYTWFNRLIAIRFMEVNDYLPSRVRVLSSENPGKAEPDMVTRPFDTDISFSDQERDAIMRMKDENKLDELFRMLFIKQCNKLHEVLPHLFDGESIESRENYLELLLTISFTDKDGILWHLIHDISEDDFNEEKEGQVEIIGWMYQYYISEKHDEVVDPLHGKTVKKEDIPAATQLFTTDWVVRYILDNSLGRYWIERHPESKLAQKLTYFVMPEEGNLLNVNESIRPEEIKILDPCVGSGHFLSYAFDVLLDIYRECGWSDRDAAKSIIESNLYGLDIDDRAAQLACFAVLMKARKYNRRILGPDTKLHVMAMQEADRVTDELVNFIVKGDQNLRNELDEIRLSFNNAKEYGSIISMPLIDTKRLYARIAEIQSETPQTLVEIQFQRQAEDLLPLIQQAEILLGKYDVVATNPPYMNKYSPLLKNYITEHYADYKGDLFSVFIYRNFGFCKLNGYSGFMTPMVWMFIRAYEELRSYIIDQKSLTTLIQFEYSAFEEATVPICSFVLKNGKSVEPMTAFRLSAYKGGMEVQKTKVLEALTSGSCAYLYRAYPENFKKISGAPIAYWASADYLNVCDDGITISSLASPKTGMTTGDNNLFLRMWFEVSSTKVFLTATSREEAIKSKAKWFPYLKGGDFRRWYGNNEYVVNWENDGFAIKNNVKQNGLKAASVRSESLYFKPLVSWSAVSSSTFSCRFNRCGSLFDSGGSSLYVEHHRFYILALLNSKVGQYALNLTNPTINYQPGDIAGIPLRISNEIEVELVTTKCVDISEADWNSYETSWNFQYHPLVGAYCISEALLSSRFELWQQQCNDRFSQLKANEEELNRIFIDIYGLQKELTPEVLDKDVTVRKADLGRDIRSLISYAMGCMLGRYSLDVPGLAYAGGTWSNSNYTSYQPDADNCIPITDEAYFDDDVVGRFVEFIRTVYGEATLEENLTFIANALGNKGNSSREIIRNYFLNDFMKDHLKTYQKRPIYWLFDSGKQNGFKALVYMHRWNEDTVGNLRVEYLHRMQRVYEKEIERMQDIIDNSRDNREINQASKRREKLVKQLKETRDYDTKIAHAALSRVKIDLDDGVKVNYEKVQKGPDGRSLGILAKI